MKTQRGVVRRRVRKGFTLVELLVVIAIIALLLAILMPALNRVRKQAESLICLTHLKENGTLIGLYTYDNNGKLPTTQSMERAWFVLLSDYYYRKNPGAFVNPGLAGSLYDIPIFRCPAEKRKEDARVKRGDVTAGFGSMYWYSRFFGCPMNSDGSPNAPFSWMWFSRIDRIKQPSTLPIFHEINTDISVTGGSNFEDSGYPHSNMYKLGWAQGNKRSHKDQQWGPAVNHLKGINYLFADCHAANMGLWPYQQTSSMLTGAAMSFASPGNADDYLIYFHPLRQLYLSGSSGPRTPGDGFPGR